MSLFHGKGWVERMQNYLTDIYKPFWKYGSMVDTTLAKMSYRHKVDLTDKDRRVLDWFEEGVKNFTHPDSWKNGILSLDARQASIIREIQREPYYQLNQAAELVMIELLQAILRHEMRDDTICVYGTAKRDDIFAGIDAIVELKEKYNWQEVVHYFWVDFCISDSKQRISEKKWSAYKVEPKQFNHDRGKTGDIIERYVCDFNPYVMSLLLATYFNYVSEGKSIGWNILALYNECRRIVTTDSRFRVKETVATTQEIARQILAV